MLEYPGQGGGGDEGGGGKSLIWRKYLRRRETSQKELSISFQPLV